MSVMPKLRSGVLVPLLPVHGKPSIGSRSILAAVAASGCHTLERQRMLRFQWCFMVLGDVTAGSLSGSTHLIRMGWWVRAATQVV
jgi:hypothetical protein